ncbi:phytoene desaturase [Anaerobacillus alkaliphilus]|uniref:4,4'-diaponeurosporene oxygenase n=1 Tax=Anaerobacillus alkaliphilus TaxID=1548597 RepID=A0A4Q0VPH1_9BACI|nr:phytoene desaturase family protein [Anaerobacillus alkaliphilus]RXI97767.1 phytoene desaturase [Anaerobacillus alkaliphilus]
MRKTVAIIGAGLGGLSAAITLAYNGYQVKVFEKNSHAGGKLVGVTSGSYNFDFGPNTITMPHVFRSVIEETNVDPNDYFTFLKLETHTRNHFHDGTSFEMSTSSEAIVEQLSRLDPYAARKFPEYLAETKRIYELANDQFFYRSFASFKDYLAPDLTKAFFKVRPFQSLDRFHQNYFHNEQIIKAFNRYATYIGSSPYLTPATFSLITYLELVDGVFFAKGGNKTIADGFLKRAEELGVEFFFNTTVKKIHTKNKLATALTLANGEMIEANYIIANGDLITTYKNLLSESERPHFRDKKIDKLEPSISAFVLLVGLKKRLPNLIHHQVYFGANYKQEFVDIFTKGNYSLDPTIYICNSSYTDPTLSPDGDNLFILVNAPATSRDGSLQVNPQQYKQRIYQILEEKGLSLKDHIAFEEVITPLDIQNKFFAHRGALYGLASNRMLNAFLRPANRSKDIENVYFCGGSTHPGGGSPMVVISGQNVAKQIINI